jgi:hypothetical protein
LSPGVEPDQRSENDDDAPVQVPVVGRHGAIVPCTNVFELEAPLRYSSARA